MYTSMLVLAFSGFSPGGADTPIWRTDYHAATREAAAEGKPVAVFLAPGEGNWRKMSQEGVPSSETLKILAARYVCVHLDTATLQGKRLAREFELGSGLGIVISDRTGQFQAFSHEGDLTDAKLRGYLQKYGDPRYVVFRTETNPGEGDYGAPPPQPVQTFRSVGRSC